MTDRNDAPQYPIDAITLLKTDHRKVKNLETIASLPGFGMAPEDHLSYSAGPNI